MLVIPADFTVDFHREDPPTPTVSYGHSHLSLGDYLLLVQLEGRANLAAHRGGLLSWVQGVLFGKLPCQLLVPEKA